MLKDTRFTYHFCILLLPFAIVHFLVRFCKKWWFLRLQPSCWLRHAFFLHTLVSYCAMHDTNLWRPLTIAIFGSFDQDCILTAHTLFSSFFPIYGCITLRLGTQSKSHVCLKIHRPLPVTSCLSYAQISPEQRKHERCTRGICLICLHVQCPLNISTIVV